MTRNVADVAYDFLLMTAKGTKNVAGLDALLELLDLFDGPTGLTGVNAVRKQAVRVEVEQLRKVAQGHP